MPVRTLSAAQEDTLAPWVLRVGAPTSSRAASRMRGRAVHGTPAPPIPALTSRRTTIGARPTAPFHRHPGARPWPGRTPLPVGHGRPRAGPLRTASPHRATCPSVAGPPPPAAGHHARAPGHPRPCRPAAGRRARAPGRPRYCHPAERRRAAGRRARAPGRRRRCHRAAALPRPGRPSQVCPGREPRRRVACPTPAAVHPPREAPRRAPPPPRGPSRAGAHRGGGARSGVTPRYRASPARYTRPASSRCGTGRPSAPPGSA
jgi:hypothetical protein